MSCFTSLMNATRFAFPPLAHQDNRNPWRRRHLVGVLIMWLSPVYISPWALFVVTLLRPIRNNENSRFLWPCIMNVGWRERNQQDATNLMFIIKLLSQHVSGIIVPIIMRTRLCTTAYGVLHWLCWLWLCGAGTRAVCTVWKLLFDSWWWV